MSKTVARFRVGEEVSLVMGSRNVRGEIVEDRGTLGVGGRRLYGVRISVAPGEDITFEMPEDELTAQEGRLEEVPRVR